MPPSSPRVREYMLPRVREYMLKLANESWLAQAIMIPLVIGGIDGCVYAVSTAESSRVSNENTRTYEANGLIGEPSWLYYQVWCYQGGSGKLVRYPGRTLSG